MPVPIPCKLCNDQLFVGDICDKCAHEGAKYKCFVCEKQLEMLKECNSPNDGTMWITHGNYGSGVYDSFHGEYLRIIVCDVCLYKKRHLAVEVIAHPQTVYTYNEPDLGNQPPK